MMALTAEDMSGIKGLFEEVITQRVDPKFARIDERFEQVDARFKHVDARFEQIGTQFEQVDGRFGELKAELIAEIQRSGRAVVDNICDVMLGGFTMVSQRFDGVDERLEGVEQRVDRVEGRLDNLHIVSNT
jgi:tetrahydromethanopterin S-methyltransferase subunit G